MTKEERLLRGITSYLTGYTENDNIGECDLTKEEIAEIKAKEKLALEVLIRFNLCEYTEAVPPHTGE